MSRGQVQWCKYEGNPIISSVRGNGTAPPGRDDCTAWRSADGKLWRMAYGAVNGESDHLPRKATS